MNEKLALSVLKESIESGVAEFCVCPGARNAPFVKALITQEKVKTYSFFEERSAAFFAVGRSRAMGRPVGVITTSGTAVGELLPATMEAFYTGVPLLLITADRPRRFRGSGAPQAAEQVGIFGKYVVFSQDVAGEDLLDLTEWDCSAPAQLNVCFEEVVGETLSTAQASSPAQFEVSSCDAVLKFDDYTLFNLDSAVNSFCEFLDKVSNPLVLVSALKSEEKESVVNFLVNLGAPVLCEGTSGLREDVRLNHLRLTQTETMWKLAEREGYPIDSIIRLGGIPTIRLWRDLEEMAGNIQVFSVSDLPFSGLSWGSVHQVSLSSFANACLSRKPKKIASVSTISSTQSACLEESLFVNGPDFSRAKQWIAKDGSICEALCQLYDEEPDAEPSLFHRLSKKIPNHSLLYIGNSQPIREWDLAACYEDRGINVQASRGLNGIDGQISTFLGLARSHCRSFAILGDLTALYDMAGPWILPQLEGVLIDLMIVNNGGGKIFSKMFSQPEFQNSHTLNFKPLAQMWNLTYERWTEIPDFTTSAQSRLIELIPNDLATKRFWKKFSRLFSEV